MWKIAGVCIVVGLLTLLAPVRANEDAAVRKVVARAIEAHGGADTLAKYKGSSAKQKGKLHIPGGAIEYTGEASMQLPDRLHFEMQFKIGDQEIKVTQVFNGDKGWLKVNGKTDELSKDMLQEAKEQMNAANIYHLICLKEKEYKLSPLGEVKVGDRPAVGVRVERKGYREVSLFFDKDKGLLLKAETRGKDVMQGGQEYTATTLYSDYKKIEGIMVAHKVTVERDGKPFMEGESTEEKVCEKVDDSAFEKP